MKIKPQINEPSAKEIAFRIYGIKVLEICELNAYDDKNFLIFADKWERCLNVIAHQFKILLSPT